VRVRVCLSVCLSGWLAGWRVGCVCVWLSVCVFRRLYLSAGSDIRLLLSVRSIRPRFGALGASEICGLQFECIRCMALKGGSSVTLHQSAGGAGGGGGSGKGAVFGDSADGFTTNEEEQADARALKEKMAGEPAGAVNSGSIPQRALQSMAPVQISKVL
jgi:hypothetical protein